MRPTLVGRITLSLTLCGGAVTAQTPTVSPPSVIDQAIIAEFPYDTWFPPPCTGIFLDVPCPGNYFADWIEALYNDAITTGCPYPNYCPDQYVTRAQMAAFMERVMKGTASWTPGDITAVTTAAGSGLQGGADTGAATLAIANGAVTKPRLAASGGTNGQVLSTDGAGLAWVDQGAFTLPYAGSGASSGDLFAVTNTGSGAAAKGSNQAGGTIGYLGATAVGVVGIGSVGVQGSHSVNPNSGQLGAASWGVYGETMTCGGEVGGVRGNSTCTGNTGTLGSPAAGVVGSSVTVAGVRGETAAGGAGGVVGTSTASNGTGVWGEANLGSMASAVYGVSASGRGVHGRNNSTGNFGLLGSAFAGVSGQSETGGYGVWGISSASDGVRGESSASTKSGVYGVTSNSSGYGVFGLNNDAGVSSEGSLGGKCDTSPAGACGTSTLSNGNGVIGTANNGVLAYGVWGRSTSGYAGFFTGNVYVNGLLSKAGGGFRIDHPLDPEDRILSHSFVESPDMMNIYNGNVVTDGDGLAVIQLPEWFEALNRDFRYQLTVIGRFAQAIVEKEIESNHFTIRTNLGNVKVSWQVTGIRRDRWANAHRIAVEEDKSPDQRGFYLNPEAWGQPQTAGVEWARHSEPPRR